MIGEDKMKVIVPVKRVVDYNLFEAMPEPTKAL
jgi:hypothetical protein